MYTRVQCDNDNENLTIYWNAWRILFLYFGSKWRCHNLYCLFITKSIPSLFIYLKNRKFTVLYLSSCDSKKYAFTSYEHTSYTVALQTISYTFCVTTKYNICIFHIVKLHKSENKINKNSTKTTHLVWRQLWQSQCVCVCIYIYRDHEHDPTVPT